MRNLLESQTAAEPRRLPEQPAGLLPPSLRFHTVTISLAALAWVLLYYVRVWGHVAGYAAAMDKWGAMASDFIAFYYPAAQEVLRTATPPLGFLYPQFFALCLVPLSWLPLYTAVCVWTGLEVLVAGLLFLLPARYILRRSRSAYYVYLLAFLCSMPIPDCIKWGQVSNLIVLCILGCMFLYHRGYQRLAAVALSVPIAIKFYPALFLIYFLLKRDYRFIVFCGLSVLFLAVAVPVCIMDESGWVLYHYVLYNNLNTVRIAVRNHDKVQYVPYLLYHWTHGTIHDLAHVVLYRRLSLSVGVINILIVNRLIRRAYEDGIFWSFVLLFASLPFLVESSWPHYFGWLPFCQAFLCLSFLNRRITAGNIAQVFLLLWPSIMLGSMLVFNWIGDYRTTQRCGVIMLSNALLLVLTWLQMPPIRGIAPAAREEEPVPAFPVKRM